MSLSNRMIVTGSNGFLGRVVVGEFKPQVDTVFLTDVQPDKKSEKYFQMDITDGDQVVKCLPEVDILIHVAGLAHVFNPTPQISELFKKVNVDGTRNVVAAALKKGTKHVVLISSVSVYRKRVGFVDESSELQPLTPYAQSKLDAEKIVTELIKNSDARLTILRLATLYGPGDPGNVGRLIRQIASDRFLMPGSGQNYKSLLHVRDAARACRCAIENQREQIEVFNVSDQPRQMLEIVNTIRSALGKTPVRFRMPVLPFLALAKLISRLPIVGKKIGRLADTLEKFTTDDAYSADKITRKLGFACREDFAAGIKEEIAEIQLKT